MIRRAGFTLIEVLVALGIFAIVASLSYRGLSAMLAAQAHLTEEAQRWQRLERFFIEFENDILYAAPRGGRDPDGLIRPAFHGLGHLEKPDDAHVSLTRFHLGQGLTNGTPQRIGYRFAPPEIKLLFWSELDAAPNARPQSLTVVEGVRAAAVRYLDKGGNWQTTWPGSSGNETPLGVEVTLEIDGIGRITRLFGR